MLAQLQALRLEGMKQALFNGTAARLGSMLKNGSPYYYYAKTGTTGDNEEKTKSKLLIRAFPLIEAGRAIAKKQPA